MEAIIRRTLILALTCAVGYGAWSEWLAPTPQDTFVAKGEDLLRERGARWQELRKADDWLNIYQELVDPSQKPLMGVSEFLKFYDTKALTVLSLELMEDKLEIDPKQRKARIVFFQRARLNVKALEAVGVTLDEEHPEHLEREAEVATDWIWRDGEWFYEIEKDLIRGRTDDGRTITAGAN